MKIRTTREFTLVEMLMVIAVIAVLMGLILPGINMAKEQAKRTRAKAEMNALKIAISQYEATYGYLPVGTSGDDVIINDKNDDGTIDDRTTGPDYPATEYDRLIAFLSQTDKSGNTYKGTGNLRGIKLLDVNKSGIYQDPWGNNYVVVIDADYTGEIAAAKITGLSDPCPTSVVIYSRGPDGIMGTDKDNVYSVETEWKGSTHKLK